LASGGAQPMHPMVTSIEEKEKKCFPISRGRKAFMLLLSKVQITLFFFLWSKMCGGF
jgi:hypothetical protein